MKLALISTNCYGDKSVPPFNMAILASYLKSKIKDLDVNIVDNNICDPYEKILELKPDLIGISAMTIDYNFAIDLAKKIKEKLKVPILIGGVHISTLPNSMDRIFDVGIIGEGEIITTNLIKYYMKEKNFKNIDNIKGIVYFKNGKLIQTKEEKQIKNLDEIAHWDRKLIDKSYFKPKFLLGNKYGVKGDIVTSRGCPYKCVFCSSSHFWKTSRFHSAKYILEEIDHLINKYDVSVIGFRDDLFVANKERLKILADEIEKRGWNKKVGFTCQVRTDLLNEEICKLLKKINIVTIGFGFESGSDKTLGYLKKNTCTIEDNKKAILLCKKYNIEVVGSLIFGSPYETIKDMEDTLKFIDFAKKQKNVRAIWHFVMTPFPGTEIWNIAKERRKVSENMDWNLLSHQSVDNPLLLDDSVNKEDFKRIFIKARKKLRYFKYKKIKNDIISNPFGFFKKQILNPDRVMKILFGRDITR